MASEGGFIARTLPGTFAAFTLHRGPYDLLSHAYSALAGWIDAEGREADGPPWEIYPTDGNPRSPHDYRTEIYWPLREVARATDQDAG